MLQSICLVTPLALTPVANNRGHSIIWLSDTLSMFKAVCVRVLSIVYIGNVYMKSFSDKPVYNIPMHEIDVRKLHNDIRSKY